MTKSYSKELHSNTFFSEICFFIRFIICWCMVAMITFTIHKYREKSTTYTYLDNKSEWFSPNIISNQTKNLWYLREYHINETKGEFNKVCKEEWYRDSVYRNDNILITWYYYKNDMFSNFRSIPNETFIINRITQPSFNTKNDVIAYMSTINDKTFSIKYTHGTTIIQSMLLYKDVIIANPLNTNYPLLLSTGMTNKMVFPIKRKNGAFYGELHVCWYSCFW